MVKMLGRGLKPQSAIRRFIESSQFAYFTRPFVFFTSQR
jgi:hypothetical protein